MDEKKDIGFWPRLATTASVMVALCLIAAKFIGWQMSGSVAVLGSLADSILDVLSSITVFFGVRYAMQPPDDNHRFGHDKAEAISSLVQLVMITGASVYVFVESIRSLITPEEIRLPTVAIWVMVFSLVLTIGLVILQTIAVRRSGSIATESDRAHFVSDILGNAGTLIAIVLANQFGWLRADGFAGLVAAVFLLSAVFGIARRALPQLLDEELGPEEREKIIAICLSVDGVKGVHGIRTRKAGQTEHIQLHLEMPGAMRLDEAHIISDHVEDLLAEAFPNADIMIHQDPYELVESEAEHERSAAPEERVSIST